ncbi:uncharacterized protein BP01DRAFT_382185 [Aspergillus saccharolyticus JOP 1030-1]|uniref:Uncharacterized protein n=1 Tax=Aspergillus saccharolyticus JOP 1030-1 TaxID=1450539 RepID=A0A319AHC7_9EURO|nr:hypothetical protein BP01DRAFT_382185 [Aspergillus saccharolyticus JOP 1030-1]PYH46002.1 hypothetical protein BP01DRAFT_382185 [Aspergillus saccharolyticus JOP 1030-1]
MNGSRVVEASREYYEDLEHLRYRCMELLDDYHEPTSFWTLGDPPPPKPEKPQGQIFTDKPYRHWPLVRGVWDPLKHGWPPEGVRLSDAWMYQVFRYMSRNERTTRYWSEFQGDGAIRANRVPMGETFVGVAHGLESYPVFKGWYVLCGGAVAKRYKTWMLSPSSYTRIGGLSNLSSLFFGVVFPQKGQIHIHREELKAHYFEHVMHIGRYPRAVVVGVEQWVACYNDYAIVYNDKFQDLPYRIVCLQQLEPQWTCTPDPNSDRLEIRQGPVVNPTPSRWSFAPVPPDFLVQF